MNAPQNPSNLARVLKVPAENSSESRRSAMARRRMPRRRRQRAGAWAALALVYLALVICTSPNFLRGAPELKPGTTWTGAGIVSPYELHVEDISLAEAERHRIESRHKKVFVQDDAAATRARQTVDALFKTILQARQEKGIDSIARLQSVIAQKHGMSLQRGTVEYLFSHAGDERLQSDLRTILHHFYTARGMTTDRALLDVSARAGRLSLVSSSGDPVTTPTLESVLSYPGETFTYLENRYLPTFAIPQEQQRAYADVAKQLLKPTLIYDRERTLAQLQQSLAGLRGIRVVQPGELIVGDGDIVTTEQAAALAALASEVRYNRMLKALGAAIAAAMAVIFVLLYARRFNPALGFTARTVLLTALPVLIAVSLGRFVLNLGGSALLGAFALPAGMVGMLGIILFDARFALMLVTMACALFGVAVGLNYPYILVGLVGGYTAVASLYTIKERREVLITGLRIALANCAAAVAVGLIIAPDRFQPAFLLAGIVNGLVCYGLAVALLPLFEAVFRVTTDVRLMELTSTHHPLLRELEEKAPGSFEHSLNVAKLAESAAEAVGARYLLVRAGAYFHDVGKMLKPKYYIENQNTSEERKIHSKLSPYMSNLIIRNHVRDGIELARKHNLPERVIDFIAQHHGTGLMKYFYAMALKKADAEDLVEEDEFRYPGPKPQTIEAAIVMLADTVEATAVAKFSSGSVDEDDLRKMVRDSILDKFNDGQFDECHMTFRDLHQISEAFVRSLMNRYHQRIDYPDLPRRDLRDVREIKDAKDARESRDPATAKA